MSAQPLLAPRRAAHDPRTGTGHGRARLVVVPLPRAGAPRAPFIVLVLGLLAGGLVGLLLLNTALAQGAFQLNDLARRGVALAEQQQALQRQLAVDAEPGTLARRARALGMVPAGEPAFLQLPQGRVLGTPHPAASLAPPVAPVSPPPPAAAATPGPMPATATPAGGKRAGHHAAAKPTPGPTVPRSHSPHHSHGGRKP